MLHGREDDECVIELAQLIVGEVERLEGEGEAMDDLVEAEGAEKRVRVRRRGGPRERLGRRCGSGSWGERVGVGGGRAGFGRLSRVGRGKGVEREEGGGERECEGG